MSELLEKIDFDALSAWMDWQGIGAGPLTDRVLLAGGSQNILIRFSCDGRYFVLRHPPLHPRPESNVTMQREARILGALRGSDVPHPGLIAACEDEAVLGAVFYLMEPIDGFNPVEGLPELHSSAPEIRHRMGLAMVEALARLGSVDYRAVGLEDFGKPQAYLERQVSRWQSQLAGYSKFASWPGPDALGDVSKIAVWLENHRPQEFEPGIIHGDYHLANVMFCQGSGEVAAIIDWELATIGDPLVDLGWILATWPEEGEDPVMKIRPWDGFPTQAEMVAHYRKVASRRHFDTGWYAVFACFKLAILLEGTFARACEGKAPKDMGDRLHARAQWLMARASRWINQGPPAGA